MTWRGFGTREDSTGVNPPPTPTFSLILLNLEGNREQDKKENKVLDRKVNHELDRAARFQGALASPSIVVVLQMQKLIKAKFLGF